MKRIAVVGIVGIPARYGGFETLVDNLTQQLSGNFQFTVYCSRAAYADLPKTYNGADLKYLPIKANGIQSILFDFVSLARSLVGYDVILVLGVSGCLFLPIVRLFSRAKIIVNIDGLEWRRQKWTGFAGKFLRLSEAAAVRYADVVVADNKVVQDYVSSAYAKPSKMIPYGADHAHRLPLTDEVISCFPFLARPYAFTVCRIEPENNVHMILEGMSRVGDLPMVFVGNWSASPYGRDLKERFASHPHLHLLDPIYDAVLLNRIRSSACVYIHGHSAGGTNPSLVEAMYLGLPVLAYDVNFNRETTENQALYFSNAEMLVSLLAGMDSQDFARMGCKLYDIAQRRYCWSAIASDYASLF